MASTPEPDSIPARAEALVAALTREQRIALVSGRDFWTTEGLLGQLESIMLTDGPHGLRRQVGDSDHVGLAESLPATCFPTACGTGLRRGISTCSPRWAVRSGARPGRRTWRCCWDQG